MRSLFKIKTPFHVAVSLLFLLATLPAFAKECDLDVRVETHGQLVIVDTCVTIRASAEQTWAVLTDFDHMDRFISNLTDSRVIASPKGQSVQVEQKGAVSFGPLSITFDSVKQNDLVPFTSIRTTLVRGTFTRFDSTTSLVAEGDKTIVTYHGEAVPEMWLPPLIGPAFVRSETREKFRELRDEVLRRKQAPAAK